MLLLLCVITTSSLVLVENYVFPSDFVDYRTISGVNGPLVVLENVKVLVVVLLSKYVGSSFL